MPGCGLNPLSLWETVRERQSTNTKWDTHSKNRMSLKRKKICHHVHGGGLRWFFSYSLILEGASRGPWPGFLSKNQASPGQRPVDVRALVNGYLIKQIQLSNHNGFTFPGMIAYPKSTSKEKKSGTIIPDSQVWKWRHPSGGVA